MQELNVIRVNSSQDCNNITTKMIMTLDRKISKEDVIFLSKGYELQLLEDIAVPYFKIIGTNFDMLGSLETNRVTISMHTDLK